VPFLRWLVSQLLRQADTVPALVWQVYNRGTEVGQTILLDALYNILDSHDLVYVVIDALDESQSRGNLLRLLNILITDPRFSKI
jgi:hypothetical protein